MTSNHIRQLAETVLIPETLSIPVVTDRRRPDRSDANPVLIPILRSPAAMEVPSPYDKGLSPDREGQYPLHGFAICAVLSASLWAIIILAVLAVLG